LPAFAAEFVSRKVDVIVASAGVGIAAAKGSTSTYRTDRPTVSKMQNGREGGTRA
jgi:hypothetical protein